MTVSGPPDPPDLPVPGPSGVTPQPVNPLTGAPIFLVRAAIIGVGSPPGTTDRVLDFSTAVTRLPVLRPVCRIPRPPARSARVAVRAAGLLARDRRALRSDQR